MRYCFDTGGREKYYKKLHVSDCVTRATAIANNMDYKKTYKLVWKFLGASPRNGVSQEATEQCLASLGWKYTELKSDSKQLSDFENPKEDLIFRLQIRECSMHVVACINGVLHDTWNCGLRNPKVIGYWKRIN